VAHWPFYEGAGDVLHDIAGGHDGTLTNMDPATDWLTGPMGMGLEFDGVDEYVQVGTRGLQAAQGTISIIAAPTAINQGDVMMFSHRLGTNDRIYIETGRASTLSVRFGAGVETDTGYGVEAGQWVHAVLVWIDDTWWAYGDGVLRKTQTDTALGGIQSYAFFGKYTKREWAGQYAAASFYSRALAAQEVGWLKAFPNIMYAAGGWQPWMVSVGAFYKTLTEAVAVADARGVEPGITLAEHPAIADTRGIEAGIALVDALQVADSSGFEAAITLLEALTAADSTGFEAALALLEGLQIADTTQREVAVGLVESIATADGAGLAAAVTLRESLNIADSRDLALAIELVEEMVGSDARDMEIAVALIEALDIADTVTPAQTVAGISRYRAWVLTGGRMR